jgi:hypothetical protein
MRKVAAALVTSVAILSSPRVAKACAVCAAGDPTLYAMGSEGSFAGRVRGSVSLRIGDAWIGERGVDALTVDERRLDLAVVWAPWKDISFSADMPLLDRTIRLDHVGSESAFAPGDLELRVRDQVWSSREDGWHQGLAFFGGLKLPTAPVERDPNGVYLPPDLQPGCSSVAPILGVSYFVGKGMITFSAAASFYLDIGFSNTTPHAGDSLRTQTTIQVQPKTWIAGRFGVDTKFEEPGTLPGDVVDKNSGGVAGYVTSELVLVPRTDWAVTVGGYFPALQAYRGKHGEGPVGSVSLVLDF